jgi:hypothetical protein
MKLPRTFKTYASAQRAMAQIMRRPGRRLIHMVVLHDERCSPHACRCRPWYRLEELTTETWLRGEREQAQWERESQS